MITRSPLAPAAFPALPAIAGVTPRVARARYKEWDRCDLTYVELPPGTTVAGGFTRNVCCSSEAEPAREQVTGGAAAERLAHAGKTNVCNRYPRRGGIRKDTG